jgi:uncharacterized membrane protein required for colicin V production
MKNSFLMKGLLSLIVGVWTWVILLIFGVLYSSPASPLYIKFGSEPSIGFMCMFFFMWCISLTVIFFIIELFVKYALPKIQKNLALTDSSSGK